MERQIAHVAARDFHEQMECLRLPKLKGRPFVLAQNGPVRTLVRVASRAARSGGIARGMLLSVAKQMRRDLVVLPYDERYYQSGSATVFHAVQQMSPLTEHAPLGKGYADLSYLAHAPHRLTDTCYRTLQELRRMGLQAVAGVASNKLVSLIAAQTLAERQQLYRVPVGEECAFLAPHSARWLPMMTASLWRKLVLMNLRSIGVLASLERDDLAVLFGRVGQLLHEQARGIDYAPLLPEKIRREKVWGCVLAPDTNDVHVLRDRLLRLVETACAELRAERLAVRSLKLELEYADRRAAQGQSKLKTAVQEEAQLKPVVEQLLHKTLKRRVAVRMMLLHCTSLTPLAAQLGLFENYFDDKQQRLHAAMDQIKERFGGKIGYVRV